jgi:type I restriction enzyme S subunit
MKHGNVRISDLIHPVRNWNPSTYVAADFVYVDISSVDAKQKRIAEPKNIPCSSAPSRARQLLESTDVLVSTVRPNLNCVAYVPGELEGAIASTGFCVLRPNKQALDSRYLFHWVQSEAFIGDMVSKATGASYPAVSDSIIHASEIPLPPLEEQRRIAAILDRAAKVRRLATESLTATSRALYESIFSRDILATDHRLARIGDIAMQLPSGYGSDPGHSPLVAPVAKVSNITADGRFHREFESRSFTQSELERLLVSEHDLLVVKSSGSKANILSGKTAICGKDEAGKLVASNFLMRLCIDQSAADPHFVWHILNSKISKDFVKKVAGTTTYPNLKWSTYVDHPIPLPSLSEQRLIRMRLDSIDALSHEKGARLAEQAGNLIAVLQHQLIGR